MVFNKIESNRYDIDLVKPFQNSKIKFLQRTGNVIQLFLDEECGCGEAAPLYPYSEESLSQLYIPYYLFQLYLLCQFQIH